MSLPGNDFLIPTFQSIRENWQSADASLGAGNVIVLNGDYTLADFVADETAAVAAINNVPVLAGTARLATAQSLRGKAALKQRVFQFRNALAAQVPGSIYIKSAPTQPHLSDSATTFLTPIDAMSAMWSQLNADTTISGFTGPLKLQGGYTQAQFHDDVEALRNTFEAQRTADNALDLARKQRDALLVAIYARLKQYVAGAKSQLASDSPVLKNLPRLTPPKGSTPPPVTVTGHWDAAKGKAVFTLSLPEGAKVTKIKVRLVTGVKWVAGNEVTIADLAPTATNFETETGLEAPGADAVYKFFTQNATNNENGGKALKISRPEA